MSSIRFLIIHAMSKCQFHLSVFILVIFGAFSLKAQYSVDDNPQPTTFWQHVQFGGGLGLGFSTGYTEIAVAPSAIYNFNRMFAAGCGLNYSYISAKGFYTSSLYGGNIIGLMNPIPQIQLSVSLSQSFVNNKFPLAGGGTLYDNFWLTGLYLGAGYCTGNVTVGVTYNVLHNPEKDVTNDAFMPFIRAYF